MSVSPGTGAQFAILPAQNASGNWVKMAQRIPVRIVTGKKSRLLRAGMSGSSRSNQPSPLPDRLGPGIGGGGACAVIPVDIGRAGDAADKVRRMLVTFCTMPATIMQALDMTIANVALPYMQGTFSATLDQVTWVLTSYIVAAAIMTSPIGGSPPGSDARALLVSAAGFTWRPCFAGSPRRSSRGDLPAAPGHVRRGPRAASQAMMLDSYSLQEHGPAMAIWVSASWSGPSWGRRWAAGSRKPTAGAGSSTSKCRSGSGRIRNLLFVAETQKHEQLSFDWFGFLTLASPSVPSSYLRPRRAA